MSDRSSISKPRPGLGASIHDPRSPRYNGASYNGANARATPAAHQAPRMRNPVLCGQHEAEDFQVQADGRVLQNLALRADKLLQAQGMTTDAVLDLFMDLKRHEHVLARRTLPKALAQKLQRVLKALPGAISAGRLECARLSLDNREALCNGLGVLLRARQWIFMPGGKGLAELNQAARRLTDGILCGLGDARSYDAARQIGAVLNLLNWVSRGLKAGVLVPTERIKAAFGAALEVLPEQGMHFTVEQWGKSCIQLNTMQNFGLLDLQHPPERARFQAALAHFLGPGFHGLAARASLYELGHAGNALKDSLEKGVWNADAAGAAASRLISCCKPLLAGPVKPAEEVSLVNFSNLLRVLHEHAKAFADAGMVFSADFDAVCLAILQWAGDGRQPGQPQGQPQLSDLQTRANLASFAKAMDKRWGRAQRALTTQTMAALLKPVDAAMVAHADSRSISALLGALAHFRQGGWQTQASAQAGRTLARACDPGPGQHWHDESVAPVLHGLTVLLQTGPAQTELDREDAVGAALVRMLRHLGTMVGRHLDAQSRLYCLRALHHALTRELWNMVASQEALAVLLGRPDAGKAYGLADVEAALQRLERDPSLAAPGDDTEAVKSAPASPSATGAGKIPAKTHENKIKGPSYRAETDAAAPPRKPEPRSQAKPADAWQWVAGKGKFSRPWETDSLAQAPVPLPSLAPRPVESALAPEKKPEKKQQGRQPPALAIRAKGDSSSSNTHTHAQDAQPGAQARASVTGLKDEMFALLQARQRKKGKGKQAAPLSNAQLLSRFKTLAQENPGCFPQVLDLRDHAGRLMLHHAVVNGMPGLADWLCGQGGIPAGMETAWLLGVLEDIDDDSTAARKSLGIALERLKKPSRKALAAEFRQYMREHGQDRFAHLFECQKLLQQHGLMDSAPLRPALAPGAAAVADLAEDWGRALDQGAQMRLERAMLIDKIHTRQSGYFQCLLDSADSGRIMLGHGGTLLMEAARAGEWEVMNALLDCPSWPRQARMAACAKALRQAVCVGELYMHWYKYSKAGSITMDHSEACTELRFHVGAETHRYPVDIPPLIATLKRLPRAPDGSIASKDCRDFMLYKFFRSTSIVADLQKELSGTDEFYQAYSCLHLPIRFGYTDLIEPLLELGANPDGHDGSAERTSVLSVAVAENNLAAIDILMRHGANASAPDLSRVSPSMRAIRQGSNEAFWLMANTQGRWH